MAAGGIYGIGRAWEVLSAFIGKLRCDVIGIQVTRRSGQSIVKAGYMVYYSGESGGESQKKGHRGVGLTTRVHQ